MRVACSVAQLEAFVAAEAAAAAAAAPVVTRPQLLGAGLDPAGIEVLLRAGLLAAGAGDAIATPYAEVVALLHDLRPANECGPALGCSAASATNLVQWGVFLGVSRGGVMCLPQSRALDLMAGNLTEMCVGGQALFKDVFAYDTEMSFEEYVRDVLEADPTQGYFSVPDPDGGPATVLVCRYGLEADSGLNLPPPV